MSKFSFSDRSLGKLEGVHPDLVKLCDAALAITEMDFGIICGLRTEAEQLRLVSDGKSKTKNSRHLTGHAVDVAPYWHGRSRDAWPFFYPVADAFGQASRDLNIQMRWGGAWDVDPWRFRDSSAMQIQYLLSRDPDRKDVFLDGPHFELFRGAYPADAKDSGDILTA